MPQLRIARHEVFAQHIAAGETNLEAYLSAGYTFISQQTTSACASRLLKNANVAARVAELRAGIALRHEITVDSLVQKLEDIAAQASSLGQTAAAVSAVKEIAILAGLRVEKRDNTNRNINEMSDDELASIAAGGRAATAEPARRASKLN